MENTLNDLYVNVGPEHQVEKELNIICEKVETGKSSFGVSRIGGRNASDRLVEDCKRKEDSG